MTVEIYRLYIEIPRAYVCRAVHLAASPVVSGGRPTLKAVTPAITYLVPL
jgi:hypothetical protein